MKHLYKIKQRLSLLLLSGILMLCLSFILINCGKGPQGKITNPDSGQFAVDFSQAPGGVGGIVYVVSNELLHKQGAEVTVEAWVKRGTDNLNGIIFSRHSSEGIAMWVKDNEPKFALRRLVSGTSTDFLVESGVTLSANTWHHIAGVLANALHTHPSSTFGAACATASSETSHLDIYVDGELKNCASTSSLSMPDLTCPAESLGAGSCEGDTLAVGGSVAISGVCNITSTAISQCADKTTQSLNGIIDEVRYWTTARTEAQIQACMNQELVFSSTGDCGINNINLGAYLRFNEGAGSAPSEWTGLGAGSKEDNAAPADSPERVWDGGWVSGAPVTRNP